jgi:uncharacterized protein with NAD-binding domain and iron-sulfur cluster
MTDEQRIRHPQSSAQTYHAIGYRDALAGVLACARANGSDAAIRHAAQVLLALDPEHCHAKASLAKREKI